MKNKKYLLILQMILLTLLLASCGTAKKEKKAYAPKLKQYKDYMFQCKYDSKILKYKLSEPNDTISYGLVFTNNLKTASEDVLSGNILYAAESPSSIEVDEDVLANMPIIVKTYFNSLFGSNDSSAGTVKKTGDTYEFTEKFKNQDCRGKMYFIDDEKIVLSVLRIKPGTNKSYRQALLNCYKSLKYKG